MKNYLYLLIISFSLTGCYTYKPKAENDGTQKNIKEQVKSDELAGNVVANPKSKLSTLEKSPQKPRIDKVRIPKPTDIKDKLEANKFYKIEVAGKPYKIQVDKWESDTLVSHIVHHPKRQLKFHKNQINEGTIAERRFSQPTADIITVLAYAGIGVGIWALVR